MNIQVNEFNEFVLFVILSVVDLNKGLELQVTTIFHTCIHERASWH